MVIKEEEIDLEGAVKKTGKTFKKIIEESKKR